MTVTERPYSVVVADPPWAFGDKLPGTRGAESHYPCMSVDDLCKLTLPPLADDALLFLWKVAAMTEEALAVMHMWGFNLKTEMVWVKCKKDVHDTDTVSDLAFGLGHYTRAAHETCIIATRGKASKLIVNKAIRSVFFAPREAHSKKPEMFYDLVEAMTGGEGPYLELFARRQRIGWNCMGYDTGVELKVST